MGLAGGRFGGTVNARRPIVRGDLRSVARSGSPLDRRAKASERPSAHCRPKSGLLESRLPAAWGKIPRTARVCGLPAGLWERWMSRRAGFYNGRKSWQNNHEGFGREYASPSNRPGSVVGSPKRVCSVDATEPPKRRGIPRPATDLGSPSFSRPELDLRADHSRGPDHAEASPTTDPGQGRGLGMELTTTAGADPNPGPNGRANARRGGSHQRPFPAGREPSLVW